MKLIKLSSDHYIIVDDSEIKIDDLYLDETNTVRFAITETKSYWAQRKGYKKITHSTRLLEPYTYDEVGEEIYGHMYDNIQRLSLSEINGLISDEHPLKNMWYERNVQNPYSSDSQSHAAFDKGFELGYNQALEDNKGKFYTEEDILGAVEVGFELGKNFDEDNPNTGLGWLIHQKNNYIQSLQPPTSWDVEFLDGKLNLL